ncbi:MAG: hypothetical protein QG665_447 [Patescibacteria group bacterium]|nr:hypothetical protein [Patescibacteria group bacterium]
MLAWVIFISPKPFLFSIFLVYFDSKYARIAQLVEHSTDTRKVLGSTPSARTNGTEWSLGAHRKQTALLSLGVERLFVAEHLLRMSQPKSTRPRRGRPWCAHNLFFAFFLPPCHNFPIN